MYISTKYLHVFLDIGDALLSSGAEIFRVEDTLNRMGYACGATQMNVFGSHRVLLLQWNFQKKMYELRQGESERPEEMILRSWRN